MRSPLVAVCLAWVALVVSSSFAQNVPTPSGQSLCDDPRARGTAAYNKYCGACYPRCGNAGSSNNDNGAAQRAPEAAAAAQRQRDAELEQQRIDAENKRRAEETEKQAKFNQDKQEALGQLKGISSGGNFDSAAGLKGLSSTDSGLKDAPNIGNSTGLKTLADVNTDSHVVDARNVPTGLPKSVAAEIPETPAGDRVRKGFEAIQDHDWKVALAWFQDALNHDPGNAGIQRLIELAEYTMERAKRPHPSTPPAKPTADTSARDKAAMAAVDKQMDDQLNADLAKSLNDFNRNYRLKNPESTKDTGSNAEFLKQEDPAWVEFFRYITSQLPKKADPNHPALIPSGTRD